MGHETQVVENFKHLKKKRIFTGDKPYKTLMHNVLKHYLNFNFFSCFFL